ncbi:MAG: LptF/LptG family permease [Victivallaceae bacterium]|nr:LptF/LptG family permease [Victivallaceae bacterium]
MKTLNIYILKSFLVTFGMAIGLLTFFMMGANVAKDLNKFVTQGLPLSSVFEFAVCLIPIALTFTIPWGVLVAVMLVFGRLSADSEITAMRACGISVLQIVSPIMIVSFLMMILCLYLQVQIGPPLLGAARQVAAKTAINHPSAMFEPGVRIKYKDSIIYIDDKEENNILKDVQIFTIGEQGKEKGEVVRDITAKQGKLLVNKKLKMLTIALFDCNIVDKKSNPPVRAFNRKVEFVIDYGKEMNSLDIGKRDKYMTLKELFGYIRIEKKLNRNTCDPEVELNQRIAFALAPIAFMLLGLPLAIRTSRRETSIGLFLSVVLAGAFFLSIILCESLTAFPKLYPQYLLWLPNLAYQLGGAYMIYKIAKH